MTTPLKKIVIVGGGAGGLEMATQLGHKLGRKKKAKITLVDRNHSHLWKPLLHEVATGSLDEGVDALSYLAHARNHHFQFQLGSVVDINREGKTITLGELRNEKGVFAATEVQRLAEYQLQMTVHEGVYHQVKRMLAAVGNKVEQLRRVQIGQLDFSSLNDLAEGEWVYLSAEQAALAKFRAESS